MRVSSARDSAVSDGSIRATDEIPTATGMLIT